jgi:hypothetical protein
MKKAEAKNLLTLSLHVAEIWQYCRRKGEGVEHIEEGRNTQRMLYSSQEVWGCEQQLTDRRRGGMRVLGVAVDLYMRDRGI